VAGVEIAVAKERGVGYDGRGKKNMGLSCGAAASTATSRLIS
jgi:phosphoribosylaminoimidazole carboxylase (NCAIR synthetase)